MSLIRAKEPNVSNNPEDFLFDDSDENSLAFVLALTLMLASNQDRMLIPGVLVISCVKVQRETVSDNSNVKVEEVNDDVNKELDQVNLPSSTAVTQKLIEASSVELPSTDPTVIHETAAPTEPRDDKTETHVDAKVEKRIKPEHKEKHKNAKTSTENSTTPDIKVLTGDKIEPKKTRADQFKAPHHSHYATGSSTLHAKPKNDKQDTPVIQDDHTKKTKCVPGKGCTIL